MGDFSQNGIISNLHDFGTKTTADIEKELVKFSKERKMELILPSLYSELKGDALPSIVKVTNIENNRVIYLRVNDRVPFVNNRIIDFSKQAAIKFNFYNKGIADVRVQLIDSGPHLL